MSRESFLVLCQQLEEHLIKCNTMLRKAVSVQEQVALTLYYLSDEGRLRKTANAFGLRKSTVSAIIRRVCKVNGPPNISIYQIQDERSGRIIVAFLC